MQKSIILWVMKLLFQIRIKIHPDLYGTGSEREAYGLYVRCKECDVKFCINPYDFAIIGSHDDNITNEVFTETYWIPYIIGSVK